MCYGITDALSLISNIILWGVGQKLLIWGLRVIVGVEPLSFKPPETVYSLKRLIGAYLNGWR